MINDRYGSKSYFFEYLQTFMITNQITLHFYISHSFYYKLWASSDGILTQFRSTYKNANFTERRRRKRTEIEAPRGTSEWNPGKILQYCPSL